MKKNKLLEWTGKTISSNQHFQEELERSLVRAYAAGKASSRGFNWNKPANKKTIVKMYGRL